MEKIPPKKTQKLGTKLSINKVKANINIAHSLTEACSLW